MPLDWNKINQEDSSVSGYDSTHEDDVIETPIKSLTKMISEPGMSPTSPKRKVSTNDLSQQNLHKLSSIETQQIWLFVPRPHNTQNTQEIHKALKQLSKVKKIFSNIGGWNVLVSNKSDAKQLILNGFKKSKFTLRFYISTKNFESNQRGTSSRKASVQKYEENKKDYETPHKQRKVRYEDQSSKKKVKYLEKKTDKKIRDEIMQEEDFFTNSKCQRQTLKEPKDHSNEESTTPELHNNAKIDEEIKILTLLQVQPGPVAQHEISSLKNQPAVDSHPSKQPDEVSQSSQSNEDHHTKGQDQQLNYDNSPGSQQQQVMEEENDSQESLQRMKKSLKRKNKKLNNKIKKPTFKGSIDNLDKNNPFSILT